MRSGPRTPFFMLSTQQGSKSARERRDQPNGIQVFGESIVGDSFHQGLGCDSVPSSTGVEMVEAHDIHVLDLGSEEFKYRSNLGYFVWHAPRIWEQMSAQVKRVNHATSKK